MSRLINNTLFLAGCDNAFRGHDEKLSSENRGGFKELLRYSFNVALFFVRRDHFKSTVEF